MDKPTQILMAVSEEEAAKIQADRQAYTDELAPNRIFHASNHRSLFSAQSESYHMRNKRAALNSTPGDGVAGNALGFRGDDNDSTRQSMGPTFHLTERQPL